MKKIVLIVLAYNIRLIGTTVQSWEFPSCDAIAEFENNTLKLEKKCDNDAADSDASYTFFLFQSEEKGKRCQWITIERQFNSLCESHRDAAARRTTRAVFQHIYSGSYCFAVYNGKWTSSFPACNTEVPFEIHKQPMEQMELDVQLWNPKLVVQQYGWNNLLVHLDISHSDGFNFKNFFIEFYKFNKDIGDCDQLPLEYDLHFEMNVSSQEILYSNLTEGYYCIQVTPDDPRCISTHSTTNRPCTRASNLTRIILSGDLDDHWNLVSVIVPLLLITASIAIVVFYKRKQMSGKEKEGENELLRSSIFLLYSNDERIRRCVQMLKEILMIDDYTDQHQWENVAKDDVSWFLSRLNQKDKYVIVIEPVLEVELGSQELNGNSHFFIGLQELNKLASEPNYQRVLTVWFQNSFNDKFQNNLFWNTFRCFHIPKDIDHLINTLKGGVEPKA